MKIRCIAVDDEPDALEKLSSYIQRTPYLELAASCEDAFEAMDAIATGNVDAVFIDINMPDLSGLEFIASLSAPPMTVFITAYAEYAVESYKVQALDYILKPYGYAEFQRAADRILSRYMEANGHELTTESDKTESIFVKVDYRWVRISPEDIRYIQGYSDYLKIYIVGKPLPLLTNSNFATIMKSLPSNFIQVHRSYIVNMNKIEEVERYRIVMDTDTRIPIGDSYKEDFSVYLNRFGVYRKKNDSSTKEDDL